MSLPALGLPLNSDDIRKLLPHSWPFLLLDRVTALTPSVRAEGVKNVAVSEPYFAGHFPHMSVMPGVLIIETLAQLAGVLMACSAVASADGESPPSGRTLLAGVSKFRFRSPATPGDQLQLTVAVEAQGAGIVQFRGTAHIDRRIAAEGSFQIAV